MFKTWRDRYLAALSKTLYVSEGAALVLFVISVVEGFGAIRAFQNAEDPSEEALFRALISPVVFFAIFGLRLVYLALMRLTLIGTSITWWLCVAGSHSASSYALYGCFLNCDPNASYPIYDLFSSFPLEVAGMLFIVLGLFRFLITAAWAFELKA